MQDIFVRVNLPNLNVFGIYIYIYIFFFFNLKKNYLILDMFLKFLIYVIYFEKLKLNIKYV